MAYRLASPLFFYNLFFVIWLTASTVSAKSAYIYRTPESPFPSGRAGLLKLKAGTKDVVSRVWMKVDFSSGREHEGLWIRRDDAVCDRDLADRGITHTEAPLRTQPRWNIPATRGLAPHTEVRILKREQNWVQISVGSHFYWIDGLTLIPRDQDWGRAITRSGAVFYNDDLKKKTAGVAVPPMSSVDVLGISDHETAHVRFKNQTGSIALGQLVTRLDFAAVIRTKNGIWLRPRRDAKGRWRVHESPLQADQIDAFRADPTVCFSVASLSRLHTLPADGSPVVARLSPLTKINQVNELNVRWGLSLVEKHGSVWWPMESQNRLPTQLTEDTPKPVTQLRANGGLRLTTQQLFQRKIQQLVKNPNPKTPFFLASANGIFRSWDGAVWDQIPFFESENHPIVISASGEIYVGTMSSSDQGETFEPYVRWEKVLNAIARSIHQSPVRMALVDMNVKFEHGLDHVLMNVDIGRNNFVQLYSPDQGQTWSAERR